MNSHDIPRESEPQSGQSSSSDESELVVVGRYLQLPEALLDKAALEAAGIECFVADDNMARMYPTNVTGGVRLEVAVRDAEEALTVLNVAMPEEFEVDGVGEYHQPKCPSCGSMDVSYASAERNELQDGWRCSQCGHEWNLDEADE
jgi:predicted RNA-binding Zn-ribbon protein involved in translation (DUF1610 family)